MLHRRVKVGAQCAVPFDLRPMSRILRAVILRQLVDKPVADGLIHFSSSFVQPMPGAIVDDEPLRLTGQIVDVYRAMR